MEGRVMRKLSLLEHFIFMYKILPDVQVIKTILKRSWKDMRKSLILDNGGKGDTCNKLVKNLA